MQIAVGVAVLLVAVALAVGAVDIPSNAGYGGVGPNFLPWLVAGVLALCGAVLVWEALSGGFQPRGGWRTWPSPWTTKRSMVSASAPIGP